MKNTRDLKNMLNDIKLESNASTPIYIESRKKDILALADKFACHKPEVLTTQENLDVITALRRFAEVGIETSYPICDEIA